LRSGGEARCFGVVERGEEPRCLTACLGGSLVLSLACHHWSKRKVLIVLFVVGERIKRKVGWACCWFGMKRQGRWLELSVLLWGEKLRKVEGQV
jgi:hypothetical protein